jgi:hypothetical protein
MLRAMVVFKSWPRPASPSTGKDLGRPKNPRIFVMLYLWSVVRRLPTVDCQPWTNNNNSIVETVEAPQLLLLSPGSILLMSFRARPFKGVGWHNFDKDEINKYHGKE